MASVALCIGGNSGDRTWYIERMETLLGRLLEPEPVVSLLMETEPLEVPPGQPWYLNRVIGGLYRRTPLELLEACRSVEAELGRTGKGLRSARTADIDILLFGSESVATEMLTIPHPGVLSRRFCLEGLFQIMPDALIATTGRTVREHYASMPASVRSQCIRFFVPQGEQHGD